MPSLCSVSNVSSPRCYYDMIQAYEYLSTGTCSAGDGKGNGVCTQFPSMKKSCQNNGRDQNSPTVRAEQIQRYGSTVWPGISEM